MLSPISTKRAGTGDNTGYYREGFGMWSRELQPGIELHRDPMGDGLSIILDAREKVSGCGKDFRMVFATAPNTEGCSLSPDIRD